MREILQSANLSNTHYELRGKISAMANTLEKQKKSVLKLHLGNPGLFGLDAPQALLEVIAKNLQDTQGYCDSKGMLCAREAIAQHAMEQEIDQAHPERIYIGNGVSELINISLQALLNPGDEVLLPQPVYPLWSAATSLTGGKVQFYRCDETNGWLPDIQHLARQINPRTKAIVVINPNNPTGSVYPKATLQAIAALAEQYQLVLFSDEIYSDIIYPGSSFEHCAKHTRDTLMITFHGLSKNYLLAGYRCAWMIVTGKTSHAQEYLKGIEKLLAMRLCANVPVQTAIATALSDKRFTLLNQYPNMITKCDEVIKRLNSIEGLSCHRPQGAFYAYPRWDKESVFWDKDEEWVLEFLQQQHILVAPGSTFAQPDQQHFRLVLLPSQNELLEACEKLEQYKINTHLRSHAIYS